MALNATSAMEMFPRTGPQEEKAAAGEPQEAEAEAEEIGTVSNPKKERKGNRRRLKNLHKAGFAKGRVHRTNRYLPL